jgi:hypothetical protein
MMTARTLKFVSSDYRELIDLLVEAVEIASVTGERPSIEVDGKTYAPYDLEKLSLLLVHDEPLQERHEAKVAKIFDKRQHGYGRTAWNLAHRANAIAAASQRKHA